CRHGRRGASSPMEDIMDEYGRKKTRGALLAAFLTLLLALGALWATGNARILPADEAQWSATIVDPDGRTAARLKAGRKRNGTKKNRNGNSVIRQIRNMTRILP
ncbi:MAG: hypothetical protein SPL79_11845, partial [Sphaerochaetaceae bacterium]|nr:hypothetical protein [Sphaerochaetaceae bacterium]